MNKARDQQLERIVTWATEREDIRAALFATNELVREIGLHLAQVLHYPYPMELDQKMTQYQLVVKSLPKETVRIG